MCRCHPSRTASYKIVDVILGLVRVCCWFTAAANISDAGNRGGEGGGGGGGGSKIEARLVRL